MRVCVRARGPGCHSHGASASVRHTGWRGADTGYTPVWVRACARARQSAQVSKGQWLRGATAKWLESSHPTNSLSNVMSPTRSPSRMGTRLHWQLPTDRKLLGQWMPDLLALRMLPTVTNCKLWLYII